MTAKILMILLKMTVYPILNLGDNVTYKQNEETISGSYK